MVINNTVQGLEAGHAHGKKIRTEHIGTLDFKCLEIQGGPTGASLMTSRCEAEG